MTRKVHIPLIVAAIALCVAGSALAQEASSDAWMTADASAAETRAKVRNDLAQARIDHSIDAVSDNHVERAQSVLSRAQVRAMLVQARASGEFAELNGEASSFPVVARLNPQLTAQKR